MNNTDKLLKEIKESTGLNIMNESFEGKSLNDLEKNVIIPLFKVDTHQPFNFGIEISYNSIRGKGSFELHFPSLYVKSEEVTEFSNEISKVSGIIHKLNEALRLDYSSEWVKQI